MQLTEREQEIIEQLINRVVEVAETAILAMAFGEDGFGRAIASHTLPTLDREVMVWVRDHLQEEE